MTIRIYGNILVNLVIRILIKNKKIENFFIFNYFYNKTYN